MNILRKMFGPSRAEIWRQLSEEIDGTYQEGSFWKGDKVEVSHGEWTVTLDKYVVSTGKVVLVFTRLRAPFVNSGDFRFKVYRKGVFSDLGKFFGMQDLEVGQEPFDEEFIIQGNDETKVRELFASAELRALISAQKDIQFCLRDDEGWFGKQFPAGVDELQFVALGIIKDKERLKKLFDLFAETLEQLCRIGSATKSAPAVKL